ncbi:MAG: dipeptidase [Planctomycetota bacterium]|nr:dipeptidase [Planctomycetota bacterium]MDA1139664.1 dipeptidase [Planctomycetota bacterium]
MAIEQVVDYINANRERYVEELMDLLRIPSISAVSEHKKDVLKAANFIADQFRAMEFDSEIVPTEGHPIVYAEKIVDASLPTMLVYGHYDVQPVDPIDLWRNDPFEPTIEGPNVVARGATDDKGQMFTHIKAAEAFYRAEGRMPVNLKYIIEGEEEVGSKHLAGFLDTYRDRLSADFAVISDTSQFAEGVPAITYGLKGLAYFQIDLKGSRQDLHSGSFGGTVSNPANVLGQIIAKLRDESGRISIPGFYDDVLPIEDWERQEFARLPFDEEGYRTYIGAAQLAGEPGYTTLERKWARPTLDVNGIWGGYAGEGSKTVLPAKAGAKISMRLVPNQHPAKIAELFTAYVREICPPTVELEIQVMTGALPCITPTDTKPMDAARIAIEKGFGKPPVMAREGGTIPVVADLKQKIGVDTILLGWGLPDDGTHSPNEKFNLGDYHRGILASAHLMNELR